MPQISVGRHHGYDTKRSTNEHRAVVQALALPPPLAARSLADQSRHGWFDGMIARLGPNECRRRVWHYTPGVLALLAAAIPYYEPVPMLILVTAALFALGLAAFVVRHQHSICRATERSCRTAIWGYAVAVVPLFLLFPRQPELPLTVTGIIAFGDGSATLFGLLAGNRKLPWNKQKSWVGSAAFIFVAVPVAMFIYWAGSIPHPSLVQAGLCSGVAVLVAGAVESLPIRLNDNGYVGTAAAVTLIVMHGLVMGWQ
jgi:dolichol kinase